MNEIYKDIPGYEGLYQISNLGNVKSVKKNKLLAKNNNGTGYLYARLSKNSQVKNHYIHRLVAIAFLDNPDNLPQVNHIDEDKTNNRVDNLEWVTAKENSNHGTRTARAARGCQKPINQYDLQGNLIKSWDSGTEIAKAFGLSSSTDITRCCKNIYKTAYGYQWRYAEQY